MKWLLFFSFILCNTFSICLFAQYEISSNPSGATIATFYIDYTVTGVVSSSSSVTAGCAWVFSSPSYNFSATFYSQKAPNSTLVCFSFNTTDFSISCLDEQNIITTQVTIFIPLSLGHLNAKILCDGKVLLAKNATIENCTDRTLPNGIAVLPPTQTYKGEAELFCERDSDLFYANGTKPLQNTTKCLPDATWFGQDNLQCWNAPSPVLTNTLSRVLAGSHINLSCSYTDVLPVGNLSSYFIGSKNYTLPKKVVFSFRVQASDNGKAVYCQAVTPYTKILPSAGLSSTWLLNVHYPPYQIASSACEWAIGVSGLCTILFFSNPPSYFDSLTKDGTFVRNDALNNITTKGEEQTFHFERNKVVPEDEGEYTLHLLTNFSGYPMLKNITFNVTTKLISTTSPPTSYGNLGLTIGASAAAVIVLILLAVLFVLYVKRRYSTKGHQDDPYVTPDDVEVATIRKNDVPPHGRGYENLATNVDVIARADGYLEFTPMNSSIIDNSKDGDAHGSNPVGVAMKEDEDGYLEATAGNSSSDKAQAQNHSHHYEEMKPSLYETILEVSKPGTGRDFKNMEGN